MRVLSGVLSVGIAMGCAFPAMADVTRGIAALEAGDVQGSVQEFQAAFEAGDGDGAFYIGRLFEVGLGTEQDMRRATELYAVAVSENSALAQNRLGLMHLNGEFVLQDYKRAAELICAAAEQDDANSQFNCGLLYSEGKGVEIDAERAFELWSAASDAGHVAAINYVALALRDGNGVEADPAKAVEQFSVTGAAGNPMGLHELAKAYATGAGVDADPVMAHGYANLAAVRGLDEARILRDELALQMDAEQLEAAQTFAREWQSTPIEQAG